MKTMTLADVILFWTLGRNPLPLDPGPSHLQ
jgi:hypothetical protein